MGAEGICREGPDFSAIIHGIRNDSIEALVL